MRKKAEPAQLTEAESRYFSEKMVWKSLEGRKGEKNYIVYCLLIKPKHTYLRTEKRSCVRRFNYGKEKHLGIISTTNSWKAAENIRNEPPK